ncbi:MAG: hypothetical protein CMJ83_03700 [Planctomycetes bacterium]|nr:hypothetical protein [Planctomycetota bacterium]
MNGKLIVSEAGRDRVHELCDERTVIGTGVDADLHLKQAEVASAHCEIKRTSSGFKIVDLETASGTTINGNVVNQHALQNGDTIQLGAARLTYLGDSAATKAKPKSAPPSPLTFHPTNEEGEPRRFYRHEGQSGLGAGPKAALILAALSILALILVWLGKSIPNEEGRKQLQEAQALIAKKNVGSVRKGLRLLETLPPGTIQERTLEEMKEKAKEKIFNLERGKTNIEAENEFRRILEYHLSHKNDTGYLRSQIPLFKKRYPDSQRIEELERRLSTAAGGGASKQAAWDAAEDGLRTFLGKDDYKGAFDVLKRMEADDDFVRGHGTRIATYRGTLERQFGRHFAKEKTRALALHQQGKVELAKRIYQTLASVGCEPYSSQAKLLLTKLQ